MTTGIYLPSRQRHYIKPPLGATIDWSHPLARGLLFYALPGGDHRRDLVVPRGPATMLYSGSNWAGATRQGSAADFTSAGWGYAGAYYPWSPMLSCLGTQITMAVRCRPVSFNTANWAELLTVPYNSPNGDPYIAIGFVTFATKPELNYSYGGAGTLIEARSTTSNFIATSDPLTMYAGTRNGTDCRFYRDGILHSTATFSTNNSPAFINKRGITLCKDADSGSNTQGIAGLADFVAIWSRPLSATELQWLTAEPYAILVSDPLRRYWLVIKPAAGGAYTVTVAGTLATGGALAKSASKVLAGALTSSGAIVKSPSKALSGAVATTGALAKSISKPLAGTLSTSGAINVLKVVIVSLSGALATSGALAKSANKALAGNLASAGTLVKAASKLTAGTLGSSGSITKIINLTGLAGTLSASGAIAVLKVYILALVGTLGTSGALVKVASKGLMGTLTTAGTLGKEVSLPTLVGTLATGGALHKVIGKSLAGVLATTGTIAMAGAATISSVIRLGGSYITKLSLAGEYVVKIVLRGKV